MGLAELLLAGAVGTAEFRAAVDGADASDIAAALGLATHDDTVVRQVVASTLPLLTRPHGS